MGQFNQVAMVKKLLGLNKNNKRRGFFVEAGAGCGEHLSNTLYLEMKYNWTGLLVEPNPDLLELLISKHRNAWILPHCLSTTPYVEVKNFDASMYNGGILMEGKPKPSELGGRDYKKLPKRQHEREIQVQCFPLYSVLKALNVMDVDYFSLDIEGAEFVVLKTIPWNKVNMTLLSVEINHAGDVFPGTRKDIRDLPDKNGYKFKQTVVIDDFFLNVKSKKDKKVEDK